MPRGSLGRLLSLRATKVATHRKFAAGRSNGFSVDILYGLMQFIVSRACMSLDGIASAFRELPPTYQTQMLPVAVTTSLCIQITYLVLMICGGSYTGTADFASAIPLIFN